MGRPEPSAGGCPAGPRRRRRAGRGGAAARRTGGVLIDAVRARERLEADRERAVGRLARLVDDFDGMVQASRDTNADDEHDPEGATIAFERSQIGALVQQVRRHLEEIDAAIARLDDGTYGACEVCGDPVGEGRLDARPEARSCIRCAASRP